LFYVYLLLYSFPKISFYQFGPWLTDHVNISVSSIRVIGENILYV